MKLNTVASLFIISISTVVILIYGKSLLIPFVFALLLWLIVREIKFLLDKVDFIKNNIPTWIKTLFTSLFLIAILALISKVITTSINTLAKSYKTYQSNVGMIMNKLNDTFNMDLMDLLKGHVSEFDFGVILGSVFNSLTDILSNAFMILLYTLFIFLEEAFFQTKLKAVFTENDQFSKVATILEKIENSVTGYLGLKTLVSLVTGILSYIVLLIIGIDSPIFWAFLIFILNFIPTIGSLIGTLFPAIFCILQFGDFTSGLMVLLFVGVVQILVGNILEPKIMGNSLNISPMVAIISLSFWGALWGVTGMILSIPITVIMVIVFSQFPKTRPIAIMLSEKGKV